MSLPIKIANNQNTQESTEGVDSSSNWHWPGILISSQTRSAPPQVIAVVGLDMEPDFNAIYKLMWLCRLIAAHLPAKWSVPCPAIPVYIHPITDPPHQQFGRWRQYWNYFPFMTHILQEIRQQLAKWSSGSTLRPEYHSIQLLSPALLLR